MIIDEESKVIFLHNPKCGGRFFRTVCAQNGLKTSLLHLGYYAEESNVDLAHVSLINLPRFVPDYKEYRIISFVRNPYNRFVSGLNMALCENDKIKGIWELYRGSIKDFCFHLLNLNYYEQDSILRNQAVPWLMPQSNFAGKTGIVLRYESLVDWRFLFNVFRIPNTNVLRIKEDYVLDDETKRMIRELYFDDEEIFCLYDKK